MTGNIRFATMAAIVAAAMIVLPNFATADTAPIEKRQEAMKTVAKNFKSIAGMAKGEEAFNADEALKSFVAMRDAVADLPALFPAGSETGNKSEASPKIFSDRAGFDSKVKAFQTDLATASQAAPANLDALKASMGMVGKNCKSCHEEYRVKKD